MENLSAFFLSSFESRREGIKENGADKEEEIKKEKKSEKKRKVKKKKGKEKSQVMRVSIIFRRRNKNETISGLLNGDKGERIWPFRALVWRSGGL